MTDKLRWAMVKRIFVLVLASIPLSGCATVCCLPHDCARAIDRLPSPCSYCRYEASSDCVDGKCHCSICRSGGLCLLARRHRECRIAVGPPAVRYQPEMPPEFLPVPPYPVFANVNMYAPYEERGAVEMGYDPELTIQGRD
jgi:hypothetical protein